MGHKTYSENVTKDLRAAGVKIDGSVLKIKAGTLGIKKLGMVDYLVKVHGYKVIFLKED